MNKRQRKKRLKIIGDRFIEVSKHCDHIIKQRRCGKAYLRMFIIRSCYSKSYKRFKKLISMYK